MDAARPLKKREKADQATFSILVVGRTFERIIGTQNMCAQKNVKEPNDKIRVGIEHHGEEIVTQRKRPMGQRE